MANLRFSLVLFFLFIFCMNISTVEPSFMARSKRGLSRQSGNRTFIESLCQKTLYPALCLQCLSPYRNSNIRNLQQLAQISLTVSLYKARYTRSYLLKVAKELNETKAKEYPIVRDCLQEVDDSVYQLSQSIRELRRFDSKAKIIAADILWHIDNIETWVSAALTDVNTCVDLFPGRRMSRLKATIKAKVLNVAQLISNSLAVFHRYASRYRAASAKNP